MAALKFAETHNLVAFLEKPKESDGFVQIVDFLNAHPINYALTVNPTIYTSCIKQFWATAKAKTVNGEMQIQALVDGKKVIITEASVRRDLQLADENGTECLPNATIFTELERMGAKTTAWNELSSTMAFAIICLATNQKFNFSKYIFDNMVKNLEGGVKFLMYPRFVQVFLDKQVEGMSKHKEIYVTPSHTKKKKQFRRKQRKDTEDPQLSGPIEPVIDDTKNVAGVPTHSNDPLLSGLGTQEDASKQGRKITDLDADAEEFEVEKVVSTAEVTTASATTTTIDELTLAQTLIEIKAAKPKAVTTTTTTAVTRPKARVVANDKGKAKMIEPEKPLKRKDQIMIDEEIAQKLQAQLDAELEEEEKLVRQRKEDANIAG
ncbi:hypothetical protein Tco_0383290 [Tanacetum coccineum]